MKPAAPAALAGAGHSAATRRRPGAGRQDRRASASSPSGSRGRAPSTPVIEQQRVVAQQARLGDAHERVAGAHRERRAADATPSITTRSNAFEARAPSAARRPHDQRGRRASSKYHLCTRKPCSARSRSARRAVVPGPAHVDAGRRARSRAASIAPPTISASASIPVDDSTSAKRESANVGLEEALDHVRDARDLDDAADDREDREDRHRHAHRGLALGDVVLRARDSRRRCPRARRSAG